MLFNMVFNMLVIRVHSPPPPHPRETNGMFKFTNIFETPL